MGQLDRFFIPKQIKVGYNERSETYTGKLGYVIYYDQKNVLRKERSWQSWRQENLGFNDYPNEPLEGFVLNKHVGGYKSDWNFRQSYCRIYDPRGFEFEITIDNLLWILDWEDCMHGKGLTGKYVYGWVYDQLVLIPCCTEDYKVSQEYSNRMFDDSDLKTKDLIPGASYKIKNEASPYIFIGNLKVQKFLGKGYISKSFFICVDKEKSSNWRRRGNKNLVIYSYNKSSILCKIADDVLSKEEVDNIVYLFNLTAFSYEFWHTTNIIEKFIPKTNWIKEHENLFAHEGWTYDKALPNYSRVAAISNNGQNVNIVKPYYHAVQRKTDGWYGSSYTDLLVKGYYNFIDLNTSMEIIKHNDMGGYKGPEYFYYSTYYSKPWKELHIYPDRGDDTEESLEFVDRDKKKYGSIYYITKDGYISDSLQQLLLKESLSFKSQIINDELKSILLPVKYDADNDIDNIEE